MSKTHLQSIVNKLENTSTQEFRRTVGNMYTTSLYISPKLIKDQIVQEVLFSRATKKGTVPKKIEAQLDTLAQECYKLVMLSAKSSSIVEISSYGTTGSVITSSGDRDNFKAIYNVTKGATAQLRRRLNTLLKSAGSEELTGNVFDIGHHEGSNVDVQMGSYLSSFQNDPNFNKFLSTQKISEIKHAIDIASRFNARGDKEFVVKCILEAKGPNRAKLESSFRDSFLKEAKKFIETHDWANQEASDSKANQIIKSLANQAVKSGAKGKTQTIRTTPSSATATGKTKGKNKAAKFDPELSDLKVDQAKSFATIKDILNAKLPQEVISNMHGARLHNRTGRFAHSVQVQFIDSTPQGYPRINYSYQRSPYDVFDPALGRAPWNTPGRDPKKLIDLSIREIAKELAIGRFYTRRA